MKHYLTLPVIAALFLLNIACTPTARWGDRAFYSPAHRGYVISQDATDDRPTQYADVILLVDPVDGKK
ncbi:MAG: hypothetical protein IPK82_31760 [Polyangiaceae bacterium]|nr:hypothetical protein [Polyangiaceae bacterium]